MVQLDVTCLKLGDYTTNFPPIHLFSPDYTDFAVLTNLVSFGVDYTGWFNEITGHGLLLHCHFTRRTLPVLSSILAEELCESSRRKPSAELDTQSSESKQNNTTSIYV